MLAIILCLFRFVRLLGSGHQAVAVENLALRLQLAVYKRKRRRPVNGSKPATGRPRTADPIALLGGTRSFSFSPTRWCAGNGNGFADSGLGCQGPKVIVEEDLPLPQKSAD
jgi:hypothetical protein